MTHRCGFMSFVALCGIMTLYHAFFRIILCFFYIANANGMNGMLSHLRAHICETGPEEPPEDGEMNDVPPPSRHRIRNSSPGVLRKNTLPLGHRGSTQYSIFTK